MSLQKEPKAPLRRPDESLDRRRVQQGAFVPVDTLDETCVIQWELKMVSVERVTSENERFNEMDKQS